MYIVFRLINWFNTTLAPFENVQFLSAIKHILLIGMANIVRSNYYIISNNIFAFLT